MDLDLPAGDPYTLDDESKKLLALREAQIVDAGSGSPSEVGDALTKAVVGGELAALEHESIALSSEHGVAGVDVAGSALHLVELEQASLVEISEATSFALVGLELALEAGELGTEKLVVWDGRLGSDRGFAGKEDLGAQQRGAHLVEDEGVECIGADVAFGAAVGFSAGAEGIVVAAPVVAMDGAVAPPHLVAVDADTTGTTDDEAPQQPSLVVDIARAPLGVVPADSPRGLEESVGHDHRAGNGDPLLAGSGPLQVGSSPGAPGGRDRLGAVEVHPSNVGFVAQQAAHRRGSPHRLGCRGGNLIGVEPPGDLPDGVPARDVVVEDPPHDSGLFLEDFEVGGDLGAAGDSPVAVGCLPGDDLANPGPPQLAPPVALGNLGFLVLGDHSLDLGEQACLGVVVVESGRVGEGHLCPEPGKLIEYQYLVGVGPGQTVR